MNEYGRIRNLLRKEPKRWLITGVAGFIGSNLLEHLLGLDQIVVGIDNFSTGKSGNLAEVRDLVSPKQWGRFTFIDGDIRQLPVCQQGCKGADYVLHQAALGSVPRSIEDPISSNENNVTGTLNMLVAARDQRVRRMMYAASSSTYGDHPGLPKIEEHIGRPLSPYAVTKYVNELYADVFARTYGLETIGLRYFNVFGRRQDPEGAYAAVIPKWVRAMLRDEDVVINGDGETSRDFCFVANAVQANIRAALADDEAQGEVFNVAVGARTSLNQLFSLIRDGLAEHQIHYTREPIHGEPQPGDIRHSLADIGKAERLLGYRPAYSVEQGIAEALPWYIERFR